LKFRILIRYLRYKIFSSSKKGHGIHSPFVFDLLLNVFNKKIAKTSFPELEDLRKKLLKSEKDFEHYDLGSGSSGIRSKRKFVKNIAKKSLLSPRYARFLFSLCNYFKPETIIELGTSFGITTLYLSQSKTDAVIYTIEGCSEISEIARDNFITANSTNINLITGPFDRELLKLLSKSGKADFVFIDGNHRKDPTLRYFKMCLEYKNENSVFIFDDIHWSLDMNEAWQEIISHPQVTVSIDLFHFGIVFFKKELSKQNFVLKF